MFQVELYVFGNCQIELLELILGASSVKDVMSIIRADLNLLVYV